MRKDEPTTIEANRWYTTSQAARLLGCSRQTLAARVKAGSVTCHRMPRVGPGTPHMRFHGSELLRVLGAAMVAPLPVPKPILPPKLAAALAAIGCE